MQNKKTKTKNQKAKHKD